MARRRSKVRSRRPAAIKRHSESAISPTTRLLRNHLLDDAAAPAPLPPDFKSSCRSRAPTCKAGARPKMSPVNMATPSAKHSTTPSTPTLLKGAVRNARQRLQQCHAPIGKQDSRNRRQERKQNAFGEQLPDDSRADGAQRATQCDFTLPAGGASEQQIRHVHASNQQHESNSAEQHE